MIAGIPEAVTGEATGKQIRITQSVIDKILRSAYRDDNGVNIGLDTIRIIVYNYA